MDTVAIIPARFNSRRFKGKPLALIGDKQMILHVVDRVNGIEGVDHVVVATDDSHIFDVVSKAGFNVTMTSVDHESGTDRVAEVARRYADNALILNVQGDLPFFNPLVGEQLINALKTIPQCDIATPVYLRSNEYQLRQTNNVKAIFSKDQSALFFTRFPVGVGLGCWYQHIGVYAYKNETLQRLTRLAPTALEKNEDLEQLRALEHGYKIHCMVTTEDCGVDINCPDDLKRIE